MTGELGRNGNAKERLEPLGEMYLQDVHAVRGRLIKL